MPRSTPWGTAQHVESLFRGVAVVSTASHGGLMVAAGTAQNLLSEAARNEAITHCGYYCYEEDCAVSVAVYDSPQIRAALYPSNRLDDLGGEEDLLQQLHLELSTHFIGYLSAIGVAPDPEQLRLHNARNAFRKARLETPETVFVSVKGEWATLIDGIVVVTDGVGRNHYATSASMDALKTKPERFLMARMADLELMSTDKLPPACERLASYLTFKRRHHENRNGRGNLERVVECIKSDWFALVQAEHGWSRDEAQTYIDRHLDLMQAAVKGGVDNSVFGGVTA